MNIEFHWEINHQYNKPSLQFVSDVEGCGPEGHEPGLTGNKEQQGCYSWLATTY